MVSPDVVAEEFCRNANLPTSKKAASDPCFDINDQFKVFVDLAASPNIYPLVTTPITLQVIEAFGTASEEILHTGADPQTTLDAIQAEYEGQMP
jgi:ABC-type glycerol-3-phosphate transport system substrate-binding protein